MILQRAHLRLQELKALLGEEGGDKLLADPSPPSYYDCRSPTHKHRHRVCLIYFVLLTIF